MKRTCAAVIFTIFLAAPAAMAQPAPAKAPGAGALTGRTGYLNLGLFGGYMFDPDMPAGMVTLDYFITDEISVGPWLHFGGAGRNQYLGVSGQVRYAPALIENSQVRPYATLGIGFMSTDFEIGDEDKGLDYLFPVGGGLEFELSDILSADVGGIFEISQESFAGITVGLKVIL